MCYNCGCGLPDDKMGDENNITNETFEKAAKASNQPLREAQENTYELLKKVLGKVD